MPILHFRFSFEISDEELIEILIAFLSETGFEGFNIEEKNLDAYIIENKLKAGQLKEIISGPVFSSLGISYTSQYLEEKNWNEVWEKSYKPVIIEGICAIVAPFHKEEGNLPPIVIEPKMSFGTGHHSTTRLMIRQMDSLDLHGKSILDMGCGTGVLGIFALKKGAKHVTAIDIDSWACENSKENYLRNNISPDKFRIMEGDRNKIPGKSFDIVLANINRNILLSDINTYSSHMHTESQLILSGILNQDFNVIDDEANGNSLKLEKKIEEGSWISILYKK